MTQCSSRMDKWQRLWEAKAEVTNTYKCSRTLSWKVRPFLTPCSPRAAHGRKYHAISPWKAAGLPRKGPETQLFLSLKSIGSRVFSPVPSPTTHMKVKFTKANKTPKTFATTRVLMSSEYQEAENTVMPKSLIQNGAGKHRTQRYTRPNEPRYIGSGRPAWGQKMDRKNSGKPFPKTITAAPISHF